MLNFNSISSFSTIVLFMIAFQVSSQQTRFRKCSNGKYAIYNKVLHSNSDSTFDYHGYKNEGKDTIYIGYEQENENSIIYYTLFNPNGQKIINKRFTLPFDFIYDPINIYSGFIILNDNQKEGCYKINGEMILPPEFEEIHYYGSPGGFLISRNGHTDFLDKFGKPLINFDYEDVIFKYNSEGIHLFYLQKGKYGIFNPQNKLWIPFRFETEPTLIGDTLYSVKENGFYGIIDKKGKNILKSSYEAPPFPISDSKWIVKKSNKYGIFNNANQKVLETQYDSIVKIKKQITKPIQNNNQFVKVLKNGKWSVYNLNQNIISIGNYDFIEGIINEILIVENNRLFYFLNMNGEPITDIPFKFYSEENNYLYLEKTDNTKMILSYSGVLSKNEFDNIVGELGYGFIGVKNNKKIALYDLYKNHMETDYLYSREDIDEEGRIDLKEFRYICNYDQDTVYKIEYLYHKNGEVRSQYTRRAGRLNGLSYLYDEMGRITGVEEYKHGKLINVTTSNYVKLTLPFPKTQYSNFLLSDDRSTIACFGMKGENKVIGTFKTHDLTPIKFFGPKNLNNIDASQFRWGGGKLNNNNLLNTNSGKLNVMSMESGEVTSPISFSYEGNFSYEERNEINVSIERLTDDSTLSIMYWLPGDSKDFQKVALVDYSLNNYLPKDTTWLEINNNLRFTHEELNNFYYHKPSKTLITDFPRTGILFFKVDGKKIKLVKTITSDTIYDFMINDLRHYNDKIFINIDNTFLDYVDLSDKHLKSTRLIDFRSRKNEMYFEFWDFEPVNKQVLISQQTYTKNDTIKNTVQLIDVKNGSKLTIAHPPNTMYGFLASDNCIFITENGFARTAGKSKEVINLEHNSVLSSNVNFLYQNGADLYLTAKINSDSLCYQINLSNGISLPLDTAKIRNAETFVNSSRIHKKLILASDKETTIKYTLDSSRITYERTDEFGDHHVNFYNTEKPLFTERHVRMDIFSDKSILLYTPDGYYMGSKQIGKFCFFESNLKKYPFEQFDLKYNRPDIVLDRLGYADSITLASLNSAYLKRLKKMNFTEEMLKNDFHLPEIKIKNFEYLPAITDSSDLNLNLDINDSKYKLDRINIYINDVPVYGSAGIDLRKENIQKVNKIVRLNLVEGKNKIQVSVLNQAGAESYKETIYITYKPIKSVKPDLYLITIGDSKYKDNRFDLTYASKDANDILLAFQNSSLYEKVNKFIYTDENVTRENIFSLKEELKKANRNDVVIITVAGHGVLDDKLDYYIATHDMDFSNPSKKGIPYEELESLLDGIAPLKKVLFLDACHSGEVDKEEVEQIAMNSSTNGSVKFRKAGAGIQKKNLGLKTTSELMGELFIDLRRGTGTTVISSAGGVELAMESDQWKNGLFTYCLLHGLKDKAADANNDGQIMLSELQTYLRKEVTLLSNGAQQPTSRIENLTMDFRVW